MNLKGMGKKPGERWKFNTLQPMLDTSAEEGLGNQDKKMFEVLCLVFFIYWGENVSCCEEKCFVSF